MMPLGYHHILLPMAIAGFGILFSIIGTLLVKITDENAKEAQVQKALNIGNWVYWINSYSLLLLVQYMLPATMKMEFFGRDARHFVDEFLYNSCCSWCCYFICYRILQDWEQNQLWL
jgi:Na+/H+-translocating membrane pyrophosphatase